MKTVLSRKSRRLLLIAALFALPVLGMGWGFVVHERQYPPYRSLQFLYGKARELYRSFYPRDDNIFGPEGRWNLRGETSSVFSGDAKLREELTRLTAIGYVGAVKPYAGPSGVVAHDPGSTQPGWNLVVSGHGPEAVLMGMDGEIAHRWSIDFEYVMQERNPRIHEERMPPRDPATEFWRRVHLLDNGDLLVIFEGQCLVKIDSSSNLVWTYPEPAHHDLDLADNGDIYVLTRQIIHDSEIAEGRPILEDFITVLDPEGRPQREVSLLQAVRNSLYEPLLLEEYGWGDPLHTNTLEILDGTQADANPAFKKGNVLVSFRNTDSIAIIDMEKGVVVWALSGMWNAQHQPTFLENGNLLIFDNLGRRGMSRVIEFDPSTLEVAWAYEGKPDGFLSETCGSNQRLANGNTLITETDSGRAFEVTQSGRIVWEYVTPHRVDSPAGELIATVLEVIRLPLDASLPFLDTAD